MSTPGRPKGESLSAQREGSPVSAAPPSLEQALARAVLRHVPELPRALLQRARQHVVDCAAVALAGASEPALVAARRALASPGAAPLLGTADHVSVRDAALLNGMAAHFHDYDDDDPALCVGHPTVAVFGALVAVGGTSTLTVGQVLTAYVVGIETIMRLGRIVNPGHYDRGSHATATLGVFGAAAASGVLLALDEARLTHAIGLAASASSGIKGNFGSDGKPFQVGLAAANGLTAALLAREGVRSAPGALFGAHGFCTMHGGRDAVDAVRRFGDPWGLVDPGLNIKCYPCCSSTHTALDGLLEILAEARATADDIASITVHIGPDVPAILIYDTPADPLQGKFSMRYCIAAATVTGGVTLDAFEPAAFESPALRAMIARVDVQVDPALPRIPTGATHASRVTVRLRSGVTLQRQVTEPRGSAARPLALDALREKFVRCGSRSLSADAAARAFDDWFAAADDASFARWLDGLCRR
jgi:2-methylcitrate dehydratase PrpD